MSEPALAAALPLTPPLAPPLAIRRLPVPQCEPPYDDEVGDETGPHGGPRPHGPARRLHGPGQGVGTAAAIALSLPLEIPEPRSPRPLRLVPPIPAVPTVPPVRPLSGDTGATPGPRRDDELERTPRAQLPDPRVTAGRLVQVLLEVLAGERPASQVLRHVSLAVYSDLVDTPPRIRSGRARPTTAPVVTSVRVSEPGDGAAEVCAVTRRAGRYRAVALRLEGQGGRWRCVALQVG